MNKSVSFNACLLSKQKIKLPVFYFSLNNKVVICFIVPTNWTVGLSVFFLVIQSRISFLRSVFHASLNNRSEDFRFYRFTLNLNKIKNFFFFFLFFRFFSKAAREVRIKPIKTGFVFLLEQFQTYNITDACSPAEILGEVFWNARAHFFCTNKILFLLFLTFFQLK